MFTAKLMYQFDRKTKQGRGNISRFKQITKKYASSELNAELKNGTLYLHLSCRQWTGCNSATDVTYNLEVTSF